MSDSKGTSISIRLTPDEADAIATAIKEKASLARKLTVVRS
jgi:hypothetical protein